MKPAWLCIMWMCVTECVFVGGVNMHVRMWEGWIFVCVCMCVYRPVQHVERSCWHGNTAKDRRDGFWSLSRYRSSQVCARLKTHTDRTGKTGTFIKYPTEMNEGKYFSVSTVQSFPRAGLWIYGEIFDDVISSWLKLWMGAGSPVSWWMKHFTQLINPH